MDDKDNERLGSKAVGGRVTADKLRQSITPITVDAILKYAEEDSKDGHFLHVIPFCMHVPDAVILDLLQLGFKCYKVKHSDGLDQWVVDWS